MANFMGLPKAIREKIYRLHLVTEDQPIRFKDHEKIFQCTEYVETQKGFRVRKMPGLFRVSRKIEDEASRIYFGENTFALWRPEELSKWRHAVWLRHVNLITKIVLLNWCNVDAPAAANKAFMQLGKLPKLHSLTVVIDESAELQRLLRYHPIIRCGGRGALSPQINLQLLRLPGMQGFRSLRKIGKLKFVKTAEAIDSEDPKDIGSIPGGLLESIRREIVNAGDVVPKNEGRPFRFLDLPAEIRNVIYKMLLLIPGSLYPIASAPITASTQYKFMPHAERVALNAPRSALDILLINRQTHDEAYEFFYQNDLVFPTPGRLLVFLTSLRDKRMECLRSLTLFNKYGVLVDKSIKHGVVTHVYPPYISRKAVDDDDLEGLDKMAVVALLLRRLPNLQKLHFMYRNKTMGYFGSPYTTPRHIDNDCDLKISHTRFMFEMRNIADIKVRDIDLELVGATCDITMMAYVNQKKAALKHLNHGLRIAQKGAVVRELFDGPDWRKEESWPVLEGSDCGFNKGCSCGPDEEWEATQAVGTPQ